MTTRDARLPGWIVPFGVFALLFLVGAQVTGLVVSPAEADMGNLQKLMYVHVPAAWLTMVAYFLVFVAGLGYLWRKRGTYDRFAAAAAEVGFVLNGLTLVLGMIWARGTWNVWWTWDPRLTSTAVLFVVFAGYLAMRSFVEDDVRRAQWSAAIGVLGFLNVILVYFSVRWFRGIHQVQSTPSTVDPQYVLGLRLNAFAFLFLLILFVAVRYHTAQLERATSAIEEERALG